MKRLVLTLICSALVGSPALPQTDDDRILAFKCDDAVVVGRLKNGDWKHVDDPDDILGHGWADAKISVRWVVKGDVQGRTVPVRYFAHTYMREDLDFMFVLSRQSDGVWAIQTGQLMSARPKLAARCG